MKVFDCDCHFSSYLYTFEHSIGVLLSFLDALLNTKYENNYSIWVILRIIFIILLLNNTLCLICSGGVHLLFGNIKLHEIDLPDREKHCKLRFILII